MLPRAIVVNTAGIALALTLGLTGASDAAVIWNEAINGDFSNSNLAPTPVGSLSAGDNEVLGSTGRNSAGVVDRDYFTFTVPVGLALSGIIVLDGTTSLGPSNTSFIGISAGNMVNHDPTVVTDASGLLGWRHYAGSPNPNSDIGINILGEIGNPPTQPPAGVPGRPGLRRRFLRVFILSGFKRPPPAAPITALILCWSRSRQAAPGCSPGLLSWRRYGGAGRRFSPRRSAVARRSLLDL